MFPGLNLSSPASYHLFSGSGSRWLKCVQFGDGSMARYLLTSRCSQASHSQTTSPEGVVSYIECPWRPGGHRSPDGRRLRAGSLTFALYSSGISRREEYRVLPLSRRRDSPAVYPGT